MYQLEIESDAERKLRKLTRELQQQLKDPLFSLLDNPRPHNAKRLKGSTEKEGWRIRVGKLRVLYFIDETEKKTTIYDIDTRDQVYKRRS